jgi:glycosyltransferase involved in cell wall biosynthesis
LVKTTLIERGYDPEWGEVLPLAVDTSLFCPLSEDERSKELSKLGLQPPLIGFVGRLTPEKGIKVLQRALEGLPATQSWSALFLGAGSQRESILRWAHDRGWSARVRVQLARHDEVPQYMGIMDVLVAPSQTTPRWKEQFGRALIEAFACGVPVVASDSGEIPYTVGNAGVIVPEADAARWAVELAALLADPTRRMHLKERGRERASEFSAINLASRYAAFYRSLASQPNRDSVK